MDRSMKIALGSGALVLALTAGGAGLAYANGNDEGGTGVTGAAADQARTAAIAAVPGGKAGAVRTGTAPAAYDVAVTKPDGSSVDVLLDKNDHVLNVRAANQDDDGDDG